MSQELDAWIERTANERESLMRYGQTGKPGNDEGRALDSLVAISMTDQAARILAESERQLTHERELAMWASRKDHPELNSRERELVEKSAIRNVQLLVESCAITYKSCLSRYFNYKPR